MTHPYSGEGFSFDLFPEMTEAVDAAYRRSNATQPETVAAEGLAAVIGEQLPAIRAEVDIMEATIWLNDEIWEASQRISGYRNIMGEYGCPMLPPLKNFMNKNTKGTDKLKRLYDAKERLTDSRVHNIDGALVGEHMRLVFVPWRLFQKALPELPQLINKMRRVQNPAAQSDIINDQLHSTYGRLLTSDDQFYAQPQFEAADRLCTSTADYLKARIEEEGEWGMVLVQTTNTPGIIDYEGKSPDELFRHRDQNLMWEDINVGSLGVFEWLAFTLQMDPTYLSQEYHSLLPANRLIYAGQEHVAIGGFRDNRVATSVTKHHNPLLSPGQKGIMPRLAVM